MNISRTAGSGTRVIEVTRRIFALAFFAAVQLGAQDTVVTLQGLGDLAGGSNDSTAHAISADGTTVVGEGSTDSGRVAFRWTAGGMNGLGVLPDGFGDSSAWGVSADGSVVVGQSASPSYPVSEAFRWTQAGGLVGLGAPAGSQGSAANAVSADGAVIVGGLAISLGTQAFQWTAGGSFSVLHPFSGLNAVSNALALSADGGVAGGFGRTPATFPNAQAFLWTAGTGAELGGLTTTGVSSAINALSADAAFAVGWSESANGIEAFRWGLEAGMTGLGDLPGGSFFSIAQGCSADGSVIVGVGNTDNGREAFLWTSTAGMVSMAEFLAGNGVNVNGWVLTEAVGVSADGSVIVGNGVNPNGDLEAWMVAVRAAPPGGGGDPGPGPNPNPNPGHGCRGGRHHVKSPNMHCMTRGPETCSVAGAYAHRWRSPRRLANTAPGWGKKRR